MKVNLAAQLFSSSVADALEYSEKELKYPQFTGSAATVQFLRTIDAALQEDTKHPSSQQLNTVPSVF